MVGEWWTLDQHNSILILILPGVLLQTFSHNVIQYIVGRAVVGFCKYYRTFSNFPRDSHHVVRPISAGSTILINGASLVNELAHPRLRGKTGGFFNVIWVRLQRTSPPIRADSSHLSVRRRNHRFLDLLRYKNQHTI